eukprot:3992387-Amphidinium_carterae.1
MPTGPAMLAREHINKMTAVVINKCPSKAMPPFLNDVSSDANGCQCVRTHRYSGLPKLYSPPSGTDLSSELLTSVMTLART